VLAAWALLKDHASDIGYRWEQSDTPRALARRLIGNAGLEGGQSEALERLARADERVRFAREPGPVGDLRGDLDIVTAALTIKAERGRRLRARFLPPSTGRLVHAMSESIADGLDWLEAIGGHLRPRKTHV
jgi:hypothetical protein